MYKGVSKLLLGAALVSVVNAHGYFSSPEPRMPGPAMQAACGQQVFNNQNSDHYGNVQAEKSVGATQQDYDATKCNLDICKGYQFADSKGAQLHAYTAGQVIPVVYEIHAKHDGRANVSVVDTATNRVIGAPLKSWDVYGSTATDTPPDELNFSITMPDLGSQCSQPGACVIQHWWDAATVNQTYEACIDFTMNGSGGGSTGGSTTGNAGSGAGSSASVSTSAPSSSAAAGSSGAGQRPTTMQTSVRATSITAVTATSTGAAPSTPTSTDDDEGEYCDDEPAAPSTSSGAGAGAGSGAATGTDGEDEECEE